MLLRTLTLRGKLKRLLKSGLPTGLVFKSSPKGTYLIARITKVNLLTVEIDFLDEDLESCLQSGVVFIADIVSIRDMSTDNARLRLMLQNPDLAIGGDEFDWCPDDECWLEDDHDHE